MSPTAHIVNPLPYSLRYRSPEIDFSTTIHPANFRAASFEVELAPSPPLALRSRDGTPSPARIDVAKGVDFDAMRGLDRLVGAIVQDISKLAVERVEEHGIGDLHVCDHLFLESALLAHAVKRRGGRVTLWPHSTNPVDVDHREPDEMDEIVAITHTGAEIVREIRRCIDPDYRRALIDRRSRYYRREIGLDQGSRRDQAMAVPRATSWLTLRPRSSS